MISIRFRPALDVPWINVEVPDDRLEEVLVRAARRICGPVDPKAEAEKEARFQEMMRARNVSHGTTK